MTELFALVKVPNWSSRIQQVKIVFLSWPSRLLLSRLDQRFLTVRADESRPTQYASHSLQDFHD